MLFHRSISTSWTALQEQLLERYNFWAAKFAALLHKECVQFSRFACLVGWLEIDAWNFLHSLSCRFPVPWTSPVSHVRSILRRVSNCRISFSWSGSWKGPNGSSAEFFNDQEGNAKRCPVEFLQSLAAQLANILAGEMPLSLSQAWPIEKTTDSDISQVTQRSLHSRDRETTESLESSSSKILAEPELEVAEVQIRGSSTKRYRFRLVCKTKWCSI